MGYIEEHIFKIISFMKNKLWNRLSIHLDLCTKFYNKRFFTLQNFPYEEAIAKWQGKFRYYVDA
jgi:hypothetical protein